MPLDEKHTRQKSKNVALFFILLGLVVLFYGLTLVKFTPPIS